MPKKYNKKAWWKYVNFFKKISLAGILVLANFAMPAIFFDQKVGAKDCPDVKIIFARGSGQERWTGQDYLTFESELKAKLDLTTLKYEFEDLDYPAISVGDIWALFTTFVSGGEAYEFGASINLGLKNLTNEVNKNSCKATKFVVAGYSQGAMVVSKAAPYLDANKIIYAATFGDPKIYLPEGSGLIPDACRGVNLSNYRVFVPDCQAYEGMLGSYQPYQPETLTDKMGTWCNYTDIFCSTYLSIKSHTSYAKDGLYADASKVIFDKITKTFNLENTYVSLHDTVFLIDSTGSMGSLINRYKTEAINLAKQTLANGGRVALYDYRDLVNGYEPVERCNFETCTLQTFQAGLDEIVALGGGDAPESLLSAGFNIMKKLNWNYGSTKSVIVLTDAPYHEPDLDGVTFTDVVNLSKKIDPVNFYFVVPRKMMESYDSLAEATGGMVVSSGSKLSVLTDTVVSRYDSLPRVEESASNPELPTIWDGGFEKIGEGEVKLSWETTGTEVIVVLNDYILGTTKENDLILGGLDLTAENTITLVPIDEIRRGKSIQLQIASEGQGTLEANPETDWVGSTDDISKDPLKAILPKAPNTGRF